MEENRKGVRPTLRAMEPGAVVSFPIEQLKSVRAQASEVGVIMNRHYRTRTNRDARLIYVTRLD